MVGKSKSSGGDSGRFGGDALVGFVVAVALLLGRLAEEGLITFFSLFKARTWAALVFFSFWVTFSAPPLEELGFAAVAEDFLAEDREDMRSRSDGFFLLVVAIAAGVAIIFFLPLRAFNSRSFIIVAPVFTPRFPM
jgi:hypothetical protein